MSLNSKTLYVRSFLILFLIGILSSCGFHLRGSGGTSSINANSILVTSQGASGVANEVKQQLQFLGITTPDSANNVEYILRLSNELRDKNILTVSSTTGKVQEYELTYSVLMSITDPDGNSISNNQAINASRDLFFDENAVLAVGEEEATIFKELQQQVAGTVLRRLQAAIQ